MLSLRYNWTCGRPGRARRAGWSWVRRVPALCLSRWLHATRGVLRYRGPEKMDNIARFAEEAARFERWLVSGTDRGADAAREGLSRLLDLYRAGIALPPARSDDLTVGDDAERIGD